MANGESSYRRYLQGDDSAAGEVIKLYRESLTFFIYRYVKNETVAEDIAIDVFSDLFVNPNKYNFKVSLKTYLFMVARSKALNYIKRNKIIKMTELTGFEPDSSLSPELQVMKKEQQKILKDALDTLPEDMKSAVYLIYFEGMSYSEAGAVMNKKEKQIDNLLYRAKQKLRSVLDGEYIK